MNYIEQLGEKALEAKRKIATASTGEKNKVLEAIAQVLLENSDAILAENEKDITNARDNGISETMVDRLRLTKERIKGIADACMELVNLEDPVGEVLQGSVRPNGMRIKCYSRCRSTLFKKWKCSNPAWWKRSDSFQYDLS